MSTKLITALDAAIALLDAEIAYREAIADDYLKPAAGTAVATARYARAG